MIITKTPLRISFLGGNTDFREYFLENGGLCLSTTIDKYVYCIVKKRFDDKIIVNYSIKEIVDKVEDLKHELVREALKLLGIEKGIEITFLADIPTKGTGLGSSSAVTVGLLNALHTYLKNVVGAYQLASEAVKIELDILHKPIGVQDQYAVSLGGLRTIKFDKDGITSDLIAMNESIKEDFNNSLILIYTNKTRKSEEILSTIDLRPETLNNNKFLASSGAKNLETGNLRSFGGKLDDYWQAKKTLCDKISTEEINQMYQTAMDNGAIGGKIIGAGGGGFLLMMFPANKREKIRQSLIKYQELPFRFESGGSQIIFNI
jgi:D-glycero-alpha-D-manno-heptose-7-phosphate kinase